MTIQLNEVNERPITPKEVRDSYLKYKDTGVSADDIKLVMVDALEGLCYWWAKRGGTPSMIANAVMGNVKECGSPPFVPLYEVRRIAARAFRRYLAEAQPLGNRLGGMLGQTDIADELSSMESWLDYRTEQFHFGIYELDRALGGGIMKGQTMSIIGNPGSMKTSLLLSGIETWVTESEEPIAFFSVDMDKVSIFERLMLRELQCGPEILRDHYYRQSPEYLQAKVQLAKRYGGGKLTVLENTVGEKWNIDKIVEYVEFNTPGLVCIDFLTQLKKPKQSDFDVVNEAIPLLKDLAHCYGCAIVVLSQMSMASRQVQASGGMGGAAKGGPTVEENVDIELELFRDTSNDPTDHTPKIIATIKKTRRGVAGGSFQLDYSGPLMQFKGTAQRVHRVRAIKPLFETGSL